MTLALPLPSRALGAIVLAAGLLAGCGATPMLHAGNFMINAGQGLPDAMLDTHLAGWVAFDEDHVDNYTRVARNNLYTQGIVRGTPEYRMRVVRINLNNPDSLLWVESGQVMFLTGAMVPDHLPRLKAGDIVEVRQTATWRSMEDFVAKGEGNVVVRVLCTKAQPDYDACLDRAPRIGRYKGVGPTGTPYPKSVAAYGFRFTPAYDANGRPVR
jgi:hypothetical protein